MELENGWRRQVKLSALQRTRLIDRRTIDKYLVGDISKEELVSSLKTYLDGEEPIAGMFFIIVLTPRVSWPEIKSGGHLVQVVRYLRDYVFNTKFFNTICLIFLPRNFLIQNFGLF